MSFITLIMAFFSISLGAMLLVRSAGLSEAMGHIVRPLGFPLYYLGGPGTFGLSDHGLLVHLFLPLAVHDSHLVHPAHQSA